MGLRVCRSMNKMLLSHVSQVDLFGPSKYEESHCTLSVLNTLEMCVVHKPKLALHWHCIGRTSLVTLNEVLRKLYNVPHLHDLGSSGVIFKTPCVRCLSSYTHCSQTYLGLFCVGHASPRNDTDRRFWRGRLLQETCLVDLDVTNIGRSADTALFHGSCWKKLVCVIAISPWLVTLKVRDNQLEYHGARMLGPALKSCAALKHLDIGGNEISSAGVLKIAEGLAIGSPQCERIEFDGSLLMDVVMPFIANPLKKLPSLHYLDFSDNHLGQDGARWIQKHCKHLKHCDFRFNTAHRDQYWRGGDLIGVCHIHVGDGALWQ